MKFLISLAAVFVITMPKTLVATEQADDIEILAKRGKGVVTQADFAARVDGVPSEMRFGIIRDPSRVRELIANMLFRAQVAADAREAEYDLDPVVSKRMKLAADKELADAWIQHLVEINSDADYEQLAWENYQVNKQNMIDPETIDFTHILISTKERSEEDALELANSLSKQIIAEPKIFEQLVLTHSEDPSLGSNQGSFKHVKRGDMVKPFENAAFALEMGEISTPVKTKYGFHIIRLDARISETQLSFEQVKEQLIKQERKKHEDRVKADYISGLTSLPVELTEEALREMVRRQFGEEVLKPQGDD